MTCAMRWEPLSILETPNVFPFRSAMLRSGLPPLTWTPHRSGDFTYVPATLNGAPTAALATAPSESMIATSTSPASNFCAMAPVPSGTIVHWKSTPRPS